LNNNCPTKTEKNIEANQKSLNGELSIKNFPNLEKVILSNNEITKLTFENCSKVKEINVYGNKLTELEVSDLQDQVEVVAN
jgi:Leucine-rich repeat (LRR) protein